MSYHDSDFAEIFTGRAKSASPKTQVEVVLLEKEAHHLRIRNDETSPPRWISRHRIKIASEKKPYATLELSETKAVELNLV